ncbi:MAG: amino acid ABC transporter substrate-binding protein, partial [Candidatus Dadabacteria bacterium]
MKIFFYILTCISIQLTALAENNIGVIIPLSGNFARYGQQIQQSLQETKSTSIKYIYEDEGCHPRKAITAYKKLTVINGIKIFIGPFCGSPQTAVAPMLPINKQIAILGSSAPRKVFQSSGGRMFSTQPSIEEESAFNAKQAYKMGSRKVVILFFENNFS